jgi:hypothetical protein
MLKLILLSSALILAHDWYPKICCDESHCRPVDCEEISYDSDWQRYMWRGALQMGWGRLAREVATDCDFGRTQWGTEPDVGRVANGISSRVDRLKGLGNAVVPQIPEIIGRAIMKAAR